MQYYKLIPQIGEGKSANAFISYSGIGDHLSFILRGEKISDIDLSKIELKNVTKTFHDLMGTGSSEFFVSDALKNIIENIESPENIHFIPVTLKDKQYWLLNILNNVEAFDWDNSEYVARDNNPKTLKKVTKLALKGECVGDRNIFRIKEQYMYVLISQTLKNAIEANNLTGIAYDNIFEIKTT